VAARRAALATVGPVKQVALREDGLTRPLRHHLPPTTPAYDELMKRHADAIAWRLTHYRDPTTNLAVFTAKFLADRDYCCDRRCRHCPYDLPEG
jgi:hypothetical protein